MLSSNIVRISVVATGLNHTIIIWLNFRVTFSFINNRFTASKKKCREKKGLKAGEKNLQPFFSGPLSIDLFDAFGKNHHHWLRFEKNDFFDSQTLAYITHFFLQSQVAMRIFFYHPGLSYLYINNYTYFCWTE